MPRTWLRDSVWVSCVFSERHPSKFPPNNLPLNLTPLTNWRKKSKHDSTRPRGFNCKTLFPYRSRLECFWFHPSLTFEGKAKSKWTPGYAPSLPADIRKGLKWLTVTNTLAYHGSELITAVKSLIVQAPDLVTIIEQKETYSKLYSNI